MKRLLTLLLMLSAWPAFGQTLPPGISPEIIEEFQNLPPSQQQALARQYGITLPSSSSALAHLPMDSYHCRVMPSCQHSRLTPQMQPT